MVPTSVHSKPRLAPNPQFRLQLWSRLLSSFDWDFTYFLYFGDPFCSHPSIGILHISPIGCVQTTLDQKGLEVKALSANAAAYHQGMVRSKSREVQRASAAAGVLPYLYGGIRGRQSGK